MTHQENIGDIKTGDLLTSSEAFTRREFLKLAFMMVEGLVAVEAARRLGMGTGRVDVAKIEAEKSAEPQIDLPPETFLTGELLWKLGLKGVPNDVLEMYNGPQIGWDLPETGGVYLIPSKYAGGKEGADSLAKTRLREKLVFRVDAGRDEVNDSGWDKNEMKLMQLLLPQAIRRNREFLGDSRWRGFVRVSRPTRKEREKLREQAYEGLGGKVTGGVFGCAGSGVDCSEKVVRVNILNSLADYASLLDAEPKKVMEMYVSQTRNLLAHEIGHVWLRDVKFGSLDTHSIIFTLGASTTLVSLIGKTPEQIMKVGESGIPDVARPEMLPWKAFKVKGKEFYAELIVELMKRYGKTEMIYSDEQVRDTAHYLFKRAGFKFSFEELMENFEKVPDEKNLPYRSMQGFVYPVEQLKGDSYNPDGMVSWWEEVPSLAPVPFGTKGWSPPPMWQPFPDKDGYYYNYKFLGNGKIGDRAPDGNSLAVATWMKGGSLSGGEILFPVGMVGVEILRAREKLTGSR